MERCNANSSTTKTSCRWTIDNIHDHPNFQRVALKIFFPEYAAIKKKRESVKKSFACDICARQAADGSNSGSPAREITAGHGPTNLLVTTHHFDAVL